MIALTKLNGQKFVVNSDLIRTVEERPDTVITLTTGDHLIVRESMREVIDRVVDFGRHLRGLLPPD